MPTVAMSRIRRRSLIAVTAGLAVAGTRVARAATGAAITGVPPSGRLEFDVFRKGDQIGTHRLTFDISGDAMTVHIVADFKVDLGPIPLFHYSLHTTELWRDGRLVGASAQTDDDGTPASMSAKLQGDRLAVDGSKSGRYLAPPGAILGTHWNRNELNGPMINPENGELLHFAVADKGIGKLDANGKTIEAVQYALAGPATLDLWYSEQSVWSALQAVAKDGSRIDYRLA
jgi:hypothetical protein